MEREKDAFSQEPETPKTPKTQNTDERPLRTRKQIIAMEILATVLFVLSLCAISVPAVLSDENGHYDNGWPFVIACGALMIAALVVLLRVWPDALVMEYESRMKKLEKLPLTVLPDAGKARIEQLLQRQGFEETPSGLYRKRSPAGIRARFWYYIALTDDAADPAAVCDALDERLAAEHTEEGQACLLAFLYKAGVTEEDGQALKEVSGSAVSAERALAGLAALNTMLPVLVDPLTGQGYYLAQKGRLTLYACGCRFLEKHLS